MSKMTESETEQLVKEAMKENNELMMDLKEAEQAQKIPQSALNEVDKAYRQMKKLLKLRSKSQLIEVVWQYGLQIKELQHMLQLAIEDNKKLESLLGEKDD